ncbi:MAG TPA: YARHG domain-containing protein [Pyrinomonadaceae bacterium]|nr:YARHG domain-containing protein [Pyrinomonadaceae bacterium]
MKKKIFILLMFIPLLAAAVSAQDDIAYRNQRWKEFNKHSFDKFDFAKTRLTKARIANLKEDAVDDFALLRGVIFGKRGRIFKERSIQEYLDKQAWYKPNKNFTNAVLSKTERLNLDFIRLTEADKHPTIEPGDMRVWQNKLITDENLREYTGAELTILIAEIEAIHGKTFPTEEWLQKYFDDRYWYKANPAYSGTILTETERKNIEKLIAEKDKGRHTAISIGDMENFQNALLTEDKLAGLSILELRILREEFWARHGKKFDAPGIRQYFEWQDWYKPAKNQSTVKLNKIEQQNVELLSAYEAKIREKLSTDLMTDDALGDMFAEDLRVLRNEIYARHGRIFKDQALQKYFTAQAWYKPNPDFKDEMLNEVESQNLVKIKAAEDSATSKFAEVEG